jgi:hypothetical protein
MQCPSSCSLIIISLTRSSLPILQSPSFLFKYNGIQGNLASPSVSCEQSSSCYKLLEGVFKARDPLRIVGTLI